MALFTFQRILGVYDGVFQANFDQKWRRRVSIMAVMTATAYIGGRS